MRIDNKTRFEILKWRINLVQKGFKSSIHNELVIVDTGYGYRQTNRLTDELLGLLELLFATKNETAEFETFPCEAF